MSFLGSVGTGTAIITAVVASEADLLDSGLIDETGLETEQINTLETDPYDLIVNTGVYLNLFHFKYEGDWWIWATDLPKKYECLPEEKGSYRVRCNYKWNNESNSFDIKFYCYTERPTTYINRNSFSRSLMSRTDDISVNKKSGKYFNLYATAYAPNPCTPRKLRLDFRDDKNTHTKKMPNFLIYKTDYCNYSIVGTPNKKCVWILTRKYALTGLQVKRLFRYIKKLGFDPSNLKADKSSIYKRTCDHRDNYRKNCTGFCTRVSRR